MADTIYLYGSLWRISLKVYKVTTFWRMVRRGKEITPQIPPQIDPTVGLLRNMWRSSRSYANYQKATDFL